MTDTSDERPRPTPRFRPGAGPRPTPRPRVAGSRRDREERDLPAAETTTPDTLSETTALSDAAPADAPAKTGAAATDVAPASRPSARKSSSRKSSSRESSSRESSSRESSSRESSSRPRGSSRAASSAASSSASAASSGSPTGRRLSGLVLALLLLCALAAAGAGFLLWQRLNPTHVDTSVFSATRSGVQTLYTYDYQDSEGSVDRQLGVLTGDLREQYETDLSQGGIIDTYEQVSATTSYEVLDVGLQQINDAQDAATLVVFGQYVVKSATTGQEQAPQGSGCEVRTDGAQACTQTLRVNAVKVDGDWKFSELTVLTSS